MSSPLLRSFQLWIIICGSPTLSGNPRPSSTAFMKGSDAAFRSALALEGGTAITSQGEQSSVYSPVHVSWCFSMRLCAWPAHLESQLAPVQHGLHEGVGGGFQVGLSTLAGAQQLLQDLRQDALLHKFTGNPSVDEADLSEIRAHALLKASSARWRQLGSKVAGLGLSLTGCASLRERLPVPSELMF